MGQRRTLLNKQTIVGRREKQRVRKGTAFAKPQDGMLVLTYKVVTITVGEAEDFTYLHPTKGFRRRATSPALTAALKKHHGKRGVEHYWNQWAQQRPTAYAERRYPLV